MESSPRAIAPQPVAPRTPRYERKEALASGGMGTIYLAHDRLAQRDVAYKCMSLDHASQYALRIALFRREYDTLARLPHPNIVEVYSYGEENGQPYYVMELLGGADLTSIAPLPIREACRVLRDIASALALVHARRLVHRDVSPNNVRLTSEGTAKLLDFGALAPFGRPVELVGTAAFIAPECFAGAALDQRSDLYSLGALAYWTLTRRTPFAIRSMSDVGEGTFDTRPAPPSDYAPELPRELDELILSMLAEDPRARPLSAAYIIDRLTSIADLGPEADERRVAQSYLEHPPLCGRDGALAMTQRAVDSARESEGRAVLIEGEAGVGKSALLEAISLYAQLHGCTVLRAQGGVTKEPFGLARTLVEAGTALYPDLPESVAATTMFRRRRETGPRAPDAVASAERHAVMIESALTMLRALTARTPVTLIVDDLHASDDESISLLASVALESARKPLALIMSCLSMHGSLEGAAYTKLVASAEHLPLGPLEPEQVGELVQAIFGAVPNSGRLGHWLFVQASGNAATTLDYLRLLLARGLVRYTLGTFTLPYDIHAQLPVADLNEAVMARLGDLSPENAGVAQLLSLHHGALTTTEIAAAAGLAPGDGLLALEDLVHRGLVAVGDAGFYIAGSSLRAALEKMPPDDLRSAMHLGLARALLASAPDYPERAYDASFHFIHAGRDDQALALVNGAHQTIYREDATRHAPLLEAALAIALKQGRSKEECLSLMLPLCTSGFHGNLGAHRRHIDTTLALMSEVCGMTLARRLQTYLGGKLALGVGMLYAACRRLVVPKRARLGSLGYMVAYFVGLAADATAIAAALGDGRTARRIFAWLTPLAALPKHSAGGVMLEFCRATVEVAAGQVDRCSAHYAALILDLAQPIKGLEHSQRSLYLGAVNGRGACEASMGNRVALELADELGTDAFFAAHAEVIRASYHAIRGDRESAERHRARAEALALRGGTSWSASSSLTILAAYAASLAEDAITLVQSVAEFELLGSEAQTMQIYKRVCEAWLEHIRGRSAKALGLFDALMESNNAREMSIALVNSALHATVLNTLGQHARAEEVCTRAAADPAHAGEQSVGMRAVLRELAVAEAGLGRHAQAATRAAQQIASALPFENPLELGAAHRDRARIAIFAGEQATFDEHFAKMESYFRSTHNPCLIRQCDALITKAERSGFRTVRRARPRSSEADALDGQTFVEPAPTDRKV